MQTLIPSKVFMFSAVAVVLAVGLAMFMMPSSSKAVDQPDRQNQNDTRVFEMRTYYASEGKIDALNKRFREHTLELFAKHGMTNIGYWQPVEQKDTLVYIVAHADMEARDKAWAAFRADPVWIEAKKASEADGIPLAKKVDTVILKPTDYSPIK